MRVRSALYVELTVTYVAAMSAVRAFFVGLREVFTLERAEARALSLDDAERARRKRFVRASRDRWNAANKLASPIAAIVLLRESLALALEAASNAPLADLVAAHVADEDIARAERFLAPIAPLSIDELPFAEVEAVRLSLERCVAAVLRAVDTRTVVAVRALRIARPIAVLAFVAWLVVPYARTHWMIHDVALGKVVTSSPLRGESPSADHVVDGKTRGTFDIATVITDHAFVMVDLGETYAIDHVRVVNRGDGWFDDILPVSLEISEDGAQFTNVARKDDHFETWTVALGGRRARFVRLIKPDHGYIAINELEVYAR